MSFLRFLRLLSFKVQGSRYKGRKSVKCEGKAKFSREGNINKEV